MARRLRPESLAVKLGGLSIAILPRSRSAPGDPRLTNSRAAHRAPKRNRRARRWKKVSERIDFCSPSALGYLSLDRSAATLSGGEAQRIRLATQIGSRLRGVLCSRRAQHRPARARQRPPSRLALNSFAISATPSSSSNTTKTPSAAPISLWTSAPAPATPAATSSPRAIRHKSKPPPRPSPVNTSAAPPRYSFPKAPQPQRQSDTNSRRQRQQSQGC